jgi:hypothetical protein
MLLDSSSFRVGIFARVLFNILPSHYNYLSFLTMFSSLVSTTKTASRRAG